MRPPFAWLLLASLTVAAQAETPPPAEPPKLSANEIIARNAKARGGVDAWRKAETMVWAGHTESSTNPERKLQFLMELKRPDRTRFEIETGTGHSIRIYDGTNGWKLRPDSRGVPVVEAYTAEELDFARGAQVIDGPLMYYAARHAAFKVDGFVAIDGDTAYVVTAHLPSGDGGHIWVDAKTFLELRFDRDVRTLTGHATTGSVRYRDYREFKGLTLPVVIETANEAAKATNKLVLEKVAINPPIEDKVFEKPPILPKHRGGIIIDTRSAAGAAMPLPARPTQPPAPPPAPPQPQP